MDGWMDGWGLAGGGAILRGRGGRGVSRGGGKAISYLFYV